MRNYNTTPGRGLNTSTAIELRKQYLAERGISIEHLEASRLYPENVNNNIESLIGSVEIPLGLVGPLVMKHKGNEELLHTAIGTLEGALVASMNRGAKAISLSGGFEAEVLYQRMYRAPLLVFKSEAEVDVVRTWTNNHFVDIKSVAESYSNHAKLEKIDCVAIENCLNLIFCYQTGDASGQNMTTTCTWHALQFIILNLETELHLELLHAVIEGNASSDKKVSTFIQKNGRGMGVRASCILSSEVIENVLRTTPEAFLNTYHPSKKLALQNGMIGYNINVANAIAGFFVATGQDLASIHESSIGILHLEAHPLGLQIELTLPSLVIGTIGGGTHLSKQNEALRMLGCEGAGKIGRFAKAISGFALALEISTFAAIVSGEFAKSHEKLGRNKPKNFFKPEQLDADFLNQHIPYFSTEKAGFAALKTGLIDNGILTNITRRTKNQKLIGFYPIEIVYEKSIGKFPILLRAKATDDDLIQGLHHMAASVSPKLSDLIYAHRHTLEYTNTHIKEQEIYRWLTVNKFTCFPKYVDCYNEAKTETHFIFQEHLNVASMQLMDSENQPELWSEIMIANVLHRLTEIQFCSLRSDSASAMPSIPNFNLHQNKSLYTALLNLAIKDESDVLWKDNLRQMHGWLENSISVKSRVKVLVHNDFNPRNIAIRENGEVCIYDWELAVWGIPQRDWIEFICFVMLDDDDGKRGMDLLQKQWALWQEHADISHADWLEQAKNAVEAFMLGRLLFYKVAGILVQLKFANRAFKNAWKLHQALQNAGTRNLVNS